LQRHAHIANDVRTDRCICPYLVVRESRQSVAASSSDLSSWAGPGGRPPCGDRSSRHRMSRGLRSTARGRDRIAGVRIGNGRRRPEDRRLSRRSIQVQIRQAPSTCEAILHACRPPGSMVVRSFVNIFLHGDDFQMVTGRPVFIPPTSRRPSMPTRRYRAGVHRGSNRCTDAGRSA
jgi:hypothetical protein